jgi:predicted RNA binding protein YcfA (HicA-like mRNA interferase family)
MGKLAPISIRDLFRRLREFGWTGPYQKGKHPYMVKGDRRLPAPNSHGSVISSELLREILNRAGISVDDWNR